MQFNSHIFIMVYLPCVVIGYFCVNRISYDIGKIFLILAGGFFYLYGGWNITLILLVSIIFNFGIAKIIEKNNQLKKFWLIVGIIGNIGLLFRFKYLNFFITNLNIVVGKEFNYYNLILPLGISFFTFQQISYLVNIYQQTLKKIDLIDYLAYILYFPKLAMGPIVEPTAFIECINDKNRKNVNWNNLAWGIKLFCFGLFKKLVLGDAFANAVSWGFSNADLATSMDWILIMLFYTFQIYFDFSGYSDMALGVSAMFNIDLPANFDSPYKALSIRDFWKRWHMTLTAFLTKYIYIPLGGNKKGKLQTYFNTMAVFFISGVWHGANWTFILWGIFHGTFSIMERVLENNIKKIMKIIRWGCTFCIVNILWLLFRSESVIEWGGIV